MLIFKKIILLFFSIKKLYQKDKKRPFRVGLKSKINTIRNGFLPESWVIYNFQKNNHKNYLSDLARILKAFRVNGNKSILLDDKLLFSYLLKDEKISKPLFYCIDQTIIDLESNERLSLNECIEIMKSGKDFVFKKNKGGGGVGISFVKFEKSKFVINGEQKDIDFLQNLLKTSSDLLIYDRIFQTGYAKEIFSSSLNTIRILTMVDPKTNEPFIASAVFRFGTSTTNGVDNWSSGGISSNINLETGRLGKAVGFPKEGKLNWLENHPDTNFKIEDFVIPDWDEISKYVLKICEKYFYFKYVGWDIIPLENDFMILEANNNSDINLLQVHEPLLSNDRIKSFYKHHKVI